MNTTASNFDIFPTIAPKSSTQPTARVFVANIPNFNPLIEQPLPAVPELVFAEPAPLPVTVPALVVEPLPEISGRDSRMLAAERTLFASLPSRARIRHETPPPTQSAFDLEEGGALVMVIALMAVVSILIGGIFLNLQAGITQTTMLDSSNSARWSAESGNDMGLWSAVQRECEPEGESTEMGYSFELYRSDFLVQPPTATNSFGVSAGCPEDGDYFLVVKAVGTDDRGFETEVLSVYEWGDGTEETAFDADATQRAMPKLITRSES